MNIKYVTVSDALFLGKKNHGTKIFSGQDGVKIEYDAEKDHVKIFCKDEMATIKHYGAIVETIGQESRKASAPAHRGPVRAQVSTPQDHVFADTPGKTRD